MPEPPPYYSADGITIYNGDNCDVMRQMPAESVDLVVTSPPYDDLRTYGGHSWDFYGVAWNLKRLLKPGGVIVWVVGDQTIDGSETGSSMRQALHFKDIGLRLHDTMIWEKTGQGACGSNLSYWQNWEYSFVISKGQPRCFNPIEDRPNEHAGKRISTTAGRRNDGEYSSRRHIIGKDQGRRFNNWRVDAQKLSDHPAPFPESLARDHIFSWSNEGDVVLDPFNGSGTTTKMAREMGRRGIGIEIHEPYCQIAVKRLAQKILF